MNRGSLNPLDLFEQRDRGTNVGEQERGIIKKTVEHFKKTALHGAAILRRGGEQETPEEDEDVSHTKSERAGKILRFMNSYHQWKAFLFPVPVRAR